jgi:eukaryotic-like serine/threonine-protein kinase
MPLSPGTKLGPYEIQSLLGAGGMGEVFRAFDTRLGRSVAIKILPATFISDPDRVHRFEQEARALAALNHPNVVAVYDFGSQNGTPFIVSELLEGRTFRDLLDRRGIGTQSALEYAAQITRGLAAAHSKGIIHRDLKPENLFLTKDGQVKIIDFGLAKSAVTAAATAANNTVEITQTVPGLILGTVGYAAPEQLRAEAVDYRCDIFSFGAVLYEMLSGQRAFQGKTSADVFSAILKDEPPELSDPNLNISPSLDRVVHRCLNKQPDCRFQSASDVAFALEAVSTTSAASPPTRPKRRYLAVLVGAAVLMGLAAAAWVAPHSRSSSALPHFRQLTFRRGSIQAARFQPDGVGIIYSAEWEGEPPQIQTGRVGDIEFRSLGLPEGTIASVSSQGGIAMLLGCEPFFASDCGGTLAEVPAGGGAPRALLEHVHYADWSPNGNNLAVVIQEPNGHNRLEYPIGHVLFETSGWLSTPRVSPDGKLVAFARHSLANDDRGNVSVVDSDGHVRAVTEELASVEGVAWSPSGEEVWVGAAANIQSSAWSDTVYAVNLKGKMRPIVRLPGIVRLHDISKDGRILISMEAWRTQLVGFFPGDRTEHPYSWLDWSVSMGSSLSRDGRQLLFTEAGGAATDEFVPYLRPTDGSAAVRLGKGAAIALSPDANWAAVNDLTSNTLSLIPTGAGQRRQLQRGDISQYDFPGWWSADGKVLTFAAQQQARGTRVYSQDLAGGPPRQRTPELQFTGMLRPHFAVTPNASRVAATPAGTWKIHIYDDTGNDLGEARGTKEDDLPAAFLEDRRLIVGPRHGGLPLQFFLVHTDTGERELWKQFAPLDRAGLRADWNLSVTPDLKYYTYSLTQASSELFIMEMPNHGSSQP